MPSITSRPTRNTQARQTLTPEAIAEIVALLDTVDPQDVVMLDDRFGPDAGKNGGQGVARSRAALALAEIERSQPNYKNFLRTHAVEVTEDGPGIFAPALSVRTTAKKPRQVKAKTEAPAPAEPAAKPAKK